MRTPTLTLNRNRNQGLVYGGESTYNGSTLAARHDAVVVGDQPRPLTLPISLSPSWWLCDFVVCVAYAFTRP